LNLVVSGRGSKHFNLKKRRGPKSFIPMVEGSAAPFMFRFDF
jgi:hypothetical protein